MGLNYIIIILGLVICFGGIYFRRVCSGILGFVWGVIGAFIVALLTVGLWNMDDETLTAIILSGAIFAFISAIHYKVCVAINGFMSSATIVLFLLMISDSMDSASGMIALAVIIGLFFAAFTYKFHDYSYIVITALSGAFTASVGLLGVMKGCDIEDVFASIIWHGAEELSPVLLGTIVLGAIGFFVQLHRLKSINTSNTDKPDNVV